MGAGRAGADSTVPASTETLGRSDSGHSGSPTMTAAPESRRMCSRSIGPASAGTGTTGTPERNPATTAVTVASVEVPLTARAGAPATAAPTASAACASCSHEPASPSTTTASE